MNKEKNFEQEIKKIYREILIVNNLSKAFARYVSTFENRTTLMVSITFGNTDAERVDKLKEEIKKEKKKTTDKNKIKELNEDFKKGKEKILKKQYKSLMYFIEKLRKTKRIKNQIFYFWTCELQSSGDLHIHISLNIHVDDLNNFFKFILEYKCKKLPRYIYQIGRVHIGLLKDLQNNVKFSLKDRNVTKFVGYRKVVKTKFHYFYTEECRTFKSGERTFLEFIDKKGLKERYNENIVDYLKKTIAAQLDYDLIQYAISKNWNEHNLKNIFKSLINEKNYNELKKIRKIGRVYSHSTFPFPFRLYQKYYMCLKEKNKKYAIYYNVINDYLDKKITIDGNRICLNNELLCG